MGKKGIAITAVVALALLIAVGWFCYGGKNEKIQGETKSTGSNEFSWQTVRGSDSQWQKNERDWFNISFQVPQEAKVEEVYYPDSDAYHLLDITLPNISPSIHINIVPNIAHVYTESGSVSAIVENLKEVEFGGFSEQFAKYAYQDVEFAHMKGVQFPPIRSMPESNEYEYIEVYTLIKTDRDTKPGEYTVYSFSLHYDNEKNNDEQKQKMKDLFTQILNSAQAL